jgi:hypothetical protein
MTAKTGPCLACAELLAPAEAHPNSRDHFRWDFSPKLPTHYVLWGTPIPVLDSTGVACPTSAPATAKCTHSSPEPILTHSGPPGGNSDEYILGSSGDRSMFMTARISADTLWPALEVTM